MKNQKKFNIDLFNPVDNHILKRQNITVKHLTLSRGFTQGSTNCTDQKCKDCLLYYKKDTTSIIVEKVKTYGKKKLENKMRGNNESNNG